MATKKIICDTDVLIDYWDISQKRHKETKEIVEKKIGLDNVVISAITKMEILQGAQNKTDEKKIIKNLHRFNIALINNDITLEAIDFFEKYHLSHGLAIPDCFIAATSSVTSLELFTYNIKDYKFIPKLKLYKI
jgi:predicted nucleic acid-binding protein